MAAPPPKPKSPSRAGELLMQKYRLEERLAVGGMGEVYRATNLDANRLVAIKLLRPELTHNTEVVRRFLREGRAANRVNHPNIVRVIDIDRAGDQIFIVQDLLDGEDLSRFLKRSGRKLPIADALQILIPVAEALAAAHDVGLVHRDLKPANVFLSKNGGEVVPMILDFGIAKVMSADIDGDTPLTQTGAPLGTPAYMSPEQIMTPRDVDARSDVWAMGILIHRTVTGRLPFHSNSPGGVMVAICTEPPRALADDLPGAPDALQDVVSGCLMRKREDRFATCNAVARALRGAAEIIAEEISGFQMSAPPEKKRTLPSLDLELPETRGPSSAPASTPHPTSGSRPIAPFPARDAFDSFDDDDMLGLAPTVLQAGASFPPPAVSSHSVAPVSGPRSVRPTVGVSHAPPSDEVVIHPVRLGILGAAATISLPYAWGVDHYRVTGLGERLGSTMMILVCAVSAVALGAAWSTSRKGYRAGTYASASWALATALQLCATYSIHADQSAAWLDLPLVIGMGAAVLSVSLIGFERAHAAFTAAKPDTLRAMLLASLALAAAAVAMRIML